MLAETEKLKTRAAYFPSLRAMSEPSSAPPPRPASGYFPPPRSTLPLTLPRRLAGLPAHPTGGMISLAYADAAPDVVRRIEERMNSRSPFPGAAVGAPAAAGASAASLGDRARIVELERLLRQRDLELSERERVLEDTQAKLNERERAIAEVENLLLARERVLMAQRRAPTLPPFAASQEERAALETLRATLDAQETAISEARTALKEREAFIEQSESTLMSKVSAQQEHEIMLDQRYEDLRRAEQDLRKRLALVDPAVAAELEADRIRKRDEFNE